MDNLPPKRLPFHSSYFLFAGACDKWRIGEKEFHLRSSYTLRNFIGVKFKTQQNQSRLSEARTAFTLVGRAVTGGEAGSSSVLGSGCRLCRCVWLVKVHQAAH